MSTKEVSGDVKKLSGELAKELKFENGAVQVPKDLYEKTLPETIKPEQIRELQKHNSVWFAAVSDAVGHMGIKEMAKDKKLEEVSAQVPLIGRDHLDVVIKREKDVRVPGTDETRKQYGVLNVGLTTQAARSARGEMHLVREELKAAAMKKLAD